MKTYTSTIIAYDYFSTCGIHFTMNNNVDQKEKRRGERERMSKNGTVVQPITLQLDVCRSFLDDKLTIHIDFISHSR